VSAADEYFKKADQAAKKQNWDYAVELILQGLIINPKDADYRRKLHQIETLAIQEKGGNPAGGMGVRLKVMPLQANIKKLSMQKKWDEAVIEIERCLRLQPQNAPTLFQLGVALENLAAVDASIAMLEDVINLDKTNVDAYRKLGELWAKKDEPEKAIQYWEKLRQFKPDDKEAAKAVRDLSAATMVKKAEDKKKQSGDESFKALLKSEEEASELEKRQKIARTDEERIEKIRLFTADLKKDMTNSRLWRELGMLYQDLKQWDKALAAFKKAREVNPHDLFAEEKIGALREAKYEEVVKQARAKLEEARAAGTATPELEEEVKKKEEQFRRFLADEYDRRVKAHPTDYELKLKFGQILLGLGRLDEAIKQFQFSVKDPKFKAASLEMLGTCFKEKGLYDLAESQYKDALNAVTEKDGEMGKGIKYNLGIVCEKKGNREGALGWYQMIMAVDIGFRDVSARVSALMNGGGAG
jgi:tetratricopeptide (TPR) repeat protein